MFGKLLNFWQLFMLYPEILIALIHNEFLNIISLIISQLWTFCAKIILELNCSKSSQNTQQKFSK